MGEMADDLIESALFYGNHLYDDDPEPPPLDLGWWTTKDRKRERLCYLTDTHILFIRSYIEKHMDKLIGQCDSDAFWWLERKLKDIEKEIRRRKKHGRLFRKR